jgi:arsenate reductase
VFYTDDFTRINCEVRRGSLGELLDAIAAHPILLQRPILTRDGKAAIGRPTEALLALL